MCCRAHAKFFSGARQHDDKEKSVNIFCCYDQKKQPHFPTFVVFVATTKNVVKMLLEIKAKLFV